MGFCALFDIDGTLIRSAGAGSRALGRAAAELHGWADALHGVVLAGNTDPAIVDEIFTARAGRRATRDERDALLDRYLAHLGAELGGGPGPLRVLPGVDAAIDACTARGAAVGLATGNVPEGARLKLAAVGLWDRFAFGGYGSDGAERHTLVRAAIGRAQAHAGRAFAAHEVLVIGDTPRDVAAARAVGAVAVAVATGGATRDDLAATAPDALFDTLDELPAWLDARG